MSPFPPGFGNVIEELDPDPLIARIEAWSRINSGSDNPAGLATMAGHVAELAAELPGEVSLVDASPVTVVLPGGQRATRVGGQSVVLRVRPDAETRVLLTGHLDTVYPLGHPFQVPHWREDGMLNAPGAADMKGGLVVMFAALAAFERQPGAARVGYDVLVNADEETGSGGSASLIASLAQQKVAALTFEPALADGTLAGSRPGSGNFSFVIAGRAAHAGRDLEHGRNAIVAASDLALRLASGVRTGLGVNPSRIDGGGPNNMVPDHAILRVNLRPRTLADQEDARVLIEGSIAAVQTLHGVRVEVVGGFGRPPKPMNVGAERLYALVRDSGADLGQVIAWRDTGGVCDGNNIMAAGVPVVDTMGVRGGLIHTADEYMIPASVAERVSLSALVLTRIAQGALA